MHISTFHCFWCCSDLCVPTLASVVEIFHPITVGSKLQVFVGRNALTPVFLATNNWISSNARHSGCAVDIFWVQTDELENDRHSDLLVFLSLPSSNPQPSLFFYKWYPHGSTYLLGSRLETIYTDARRDQSYLFSWRYVDPQGYFPYQPTAFDPVCSSTSDHPRPRHVHSAPSCDRDGVGVHRSVGWAHGGCPTCSPGRPPPQLQHLLVRTWHRWRRGFDKLLWDLWRTGPIRFFDIFSEFAWRMQRLMTILCSTIFDTCFITTNRVSILRCLNYLWTIETSRIIWNWNEMGFGALTCYRKFDRSDAPARPRIEGFFGLVCLITNSGNPMDFCLQTALSKDCVV